MKRPWQIWLVFFICLLPLIAGLAWLSVRVVRLDEAEATARRQQEATALESKFEADVRLALRRLDLTLAELLDRESAWPHYAFRSYFRPPDAPDAASIPSPLMNRNANYVKLYFQVGADGQFTSPQAPSGELALSKLPNGDKSVHENQARKRLGELANLVDRDELLALIPAESVSSDIMLAMNDTWSSANQPMAADPFAPDALTQAPSAQQNAPPNLPGESPNSENPTDSQGTLDVPDEEKYAQQLANGPPQSSYRGAELNQQARNELDYQSRRRQIESYGNAFQYTVKNREWLGQGKVVQGLNSGDVQWKDVAELGAAVEGISRPVWVGDQLMLVRRVVSEGQTTIQGVWLDWPAISKVLRQEISDLFTEVQMSPVHDEATADQARMVASAPILLTIASPSLPPFAESGITPTQWALLVAWTCLLFAAVAAAGLLLGVVSLSERRATFVSAVSHELRTPLTTFRMYSEMLAEGMVRDESQRQNYLETLRTESDRLYHLVENVLSYARLERGVRASRRTELTVGALVAATTTRLANRAEEARMSLEQNVPEEVAQTSLNTDAGAVEQILFNLIDNACKYAREATDRRIHLSATVDAHAVRFEISDHGPGIAKGEAAKLFRPFTKSARDAANSAPGVGLGLALCRRLARDLGGDLKADRPASEEANRGARFVLTLPR